MIHVSPSQLATFKDCRRKWAYRYIDGIKTPPKPTQAFGLEGHKRNENWLRHGKHVGDDDVGKVCAQGIKPGYMPTPSSDLLIESKLTIPILGGAVNMIGYIDCILPPRQAGAATTLPVAHDWKFTKDLRWAMTPAELAADSQAAVYTRWLQLKYKVPKVVARWIYFCGRVNAKSEDGRPRTPRGVKKVELTFTTAEIEANWERELEIAKQILETKTTYKKAEDVPGNELACDNYGGCDHRDRCPLGGEVSLEGLFNQWDRTHENLEVEKMSEADVLAKLRAHTASLRQQKETATETAAAETAAPTPEVEIPDLDQLTDGSAAGGLATHEETPPEVGNKEGEKPPPAEPPPQNTGIEHVAQLQNQSGRVEDPTTETGQKNLLATLQAQTGATGINPPEVAKAAELEPKVVVAKTEPPPAEPKPEATKAATPAEVAEAPPVVMGGTQVAITSEYLPEGHVHTGAVTPPAEPAAETSKPKGKPKTSKANTTKAAKVPFVVCFDAVPSKLSNGALGEVTHLADFVEPIAKAIAKGHRCDEHPTGVDHWNLIEFNKGISILAHQVANYLDTKGHRGILVVDSYTAEGRALTEVLIRRADAVFRGVR